MTKFGICLQSLIPIRKTNSERAEMVTQIIFGETYTIVESEEDWTKIILTYDSYTGWIDTKLINKLSEDQYSNITTIEKKLCSIPISFIKNQLTGKKIPIVAGSEFQFINNSDIFDVDNYKFEYADMFEKIIPAAESIITIAKQFENAPYLWGGKSILGIDCSGFSQIVYKIVGIQLLRDASLQAKQGEKVDSINNAKTGDLAFFDNDKGNITHVGIIINENKIIHASGWVRIDSINDKGIYNSDMDKYTHSLSCIRRFV